ncbi:hypothetical protein ACCO45_006792 [Purpureocillium lilacinum]
MDRATREHVAARLLGPDGLFRRRETTVIYTTHDKRVAGLADEIYEIDSDGHIQPTSSSRTDMTIPKWATGSDSGDFTAVSDDEKDAARQRNEETKREEHRDVDPRSTASMSPPRSTPIATSTAISDRAVYKRYIRSMGLINAGVFLILGLAFAFTLKFPQLWVKWWSTALVHEDPRGNGYWLGIFGLLQVLPLITIAVWVLHLMLGIVPASATDLHSALLSSTLYAPFAYVSRVDTGELLNRFDQDLVFVDGFLPINMFNTCAELFSSVFQIILIAIVSKEAFAVLPALAITLYLIQRVYLRTKQLRHMDLEWKGALHTKFGETCSGLVTIRANGWAEDMRLKFREKLDRSQEPFYLLYMVQRWLQLVLGLVVAGLAITTAGVAVSLRDKVVAGAWRLAWHFSTSRHWTSLGAIARIALFERDTPNERRGKYIAAAGVASTWPERGHVRFENVHTSYETGSELSDLDWTLRGVTFDILPGRRVAVCGRTGSGKSTLLQALLGLLKVPKGRIVVDGVDASTVEACTLRQRLTTISQDSFVDSSTFREELDPDEQHSDDTLIASLIEPNVWDKISACGGLDGKRIEANLSSSEGQLVSIARLIASASNAAGSVVILDEATSSLDYESAI